MRPTPLLLVPLLAAPAAAQDVCPEATLVLGAPTPEARLGWSVAVDGDTAAAGAPFGGPALSGLVAIHARTPAGWLLVDELAASDGALGDAFGSEVALDGDRLVVGAVWKAGPGFHSGAAYVFERVGGAWTETAKLLPSDHGVEDWFGRTVAVDGDRIVVGASFKSNPAFAQGAAYVFELQGGAWIETARLAASDGAGEDFFGGALDLDGDRILIGAHGCDDLASESGGAYVYDLVGGAWVETAKLIAADGKANDDLGIEVALAGDVALLTAFGDDGAAVDAGSTYVFQRGAGGAWAEAQELFASDAQPGDGFGSGVAIDGDVAAIGAQNAGLEAGAVYAFRRDASGAFVEEARFAGSPPGAFLGFDVAVFGDLVVGGAPESDAGAAKAGEARAARLAGDATLFGCPAWLSTGAGGAHALAVAPGPAFAGNLYFVAGSASGAAPGFAFGGVAVPLNPDPYFLYTVSNPNVPPLVGTLGALDGAGGATAAIVLPPGAASALAGTSVVHAALVLDAATLAPLAATVPVGLTLLP
jgi:hypothetical protein